MTTYKEDQLTGWITEHPERNGVYQQLCGLKKDVGFQKYTNGKWGMWCKTATEADGSQSFYAHFGEKWRGLNYNPNPTSHQNKTKP